MNTLKILYIHHVNTGHDSGRVKKIWCKVLDKIPQEQRNDILPVLDSYHSAVEYQGFVTGFRAAMDLCGRCSR